MKMIEGNIHFENQESLKNKGEAYQELQNKINELYQYINKTQYSQLTNCMIEIIMNGNYVGITTILSKIVKGFLQTITNEEQEHKYNLISDYQKFKIIEKANQEAIDKKIIELRQEIVTERNKLQNVYREEKEQEQINEKIKLLQNKLSEQLKAQQDYEQIQHEKIMKINQIVSQIEMKQFSLEFLYRELYIHGYSKLICNPQSESTFKDYLTLAKLQICQGQPFELIDGNNFQFIKDVYQLVFDDETAQNEIMIISIVGAQSSGKSLLLSILFGPQFLYSAYRCSRGIYGCLLDIKGVSRFKKVLILEADMIQTADENDFFEKRVLFFILSISHIVLICFKSGINQGMNQNLLLAIDCLTVLKQNIALHPQVNFIINNSTSDANLLQTTEDIQNELYKCNFQEIFRIGPENVFLLPYAFAQSGQNDFIAFNLSPHFTSKVDQIKKKIFDFINYGDGENKFAKFNLKGWIEQAQQWWEFTNQWKKLTDFQNLEEKLEDKKTLKYVDEIINQYFDDINQDNENMQQVKTDVNKILLQQKSFDQTFIEDILNKTIHQLEHGIIKRANEELEKQFKAFVDNNEISIRTIKKRKETLNTEIETRVFQWKNEAMKMLTAHIKNRNQGKN